jgi:hypothetical protein
VAGVRTVCLGPHQFCVGLELPNCSPRQSTHGRAALRGPGSPACSAGRDARREGIRACQSSRTRSRLCRITATRRVGLDHGIGRSDGLCKGVVVAACAAGAPPAAWQSVYDGPVDALAPAISCQHLAARVAPTSVPAPGRAARLRGARPAQSAHRDSRDRSFPP